MKDKERLLSAAQALGMAVHNGAAWDSRVTHVISPPHFRTFKVIVGQGDFVCILGKMRSEQIRCYELTPLSPDPATIGASGYSQGPVDDAGAVAT